MMVMMMTTTMLLLLLLSATATTCVNEYGNKRRQKSPFVQGIHIFSDLYVIKMFTSMTVCFVALPFILKKKIMLIQMTQTTTKKKQQIFYFHYKSNKRYLNVSNSDNWFSRHTCVPSIFENMNACVCVCVPMNVTDTSDQKEFGGVHTPHSTKKNVME